MNGITAEYENAHPVINNPIAGSVIVRPTLISLSFNAGFKNDINSLTMMGMLRTIPINAAMYTCEKNAWPGAVWINWTPSGTYSPLITFVNCAAMLFRGSGYG